MGRLSSSRAKMSKFGLWKFAARFGFGAKQLQGGGAGTASAKAAKERLQVMIASRKLQENADLSSMQTELLTVVERYFKVNATDVSVTVRKDGPLEVFEMQVP